jgi:hypothetical protein
MDLRILNAAAVFGLVVFGGASAGPLEDGLKAFGNGDYIEAMRLWRPLAEEGNAGAQAVLGLMYEEGDGVARDYPMAAFWYTKAAEQGDCVAQIIIGKMYWLGRGVPKNEVIAYMWEYLAAARATDNRDRENAVQSRDSIALAMTPAQIGEAQRLSREWVQSHPLRPR